MTPSLAHILVDDEKGTGTHLWLKTMRGMGSELKAAVGGLPTSKRGPCIN